MTELRDQSNGPSDEAMQHLALLLAHRPVEGDLHVVLKPDRCNLCKELADWSADRTGIGIDG